MGLPLHYAQIWGRRKLTDRWNDIHVMQDGTGCECRVDCFCEPELNFHDEETDRRVFIHKSLDQLNN